MADKMQKVFEELTDEIDAQLERAAGKPVPYALIACDLDAERGLGGQIISNTGDDGMETLATIFVQRTTEQALSKHKGDKVQKLFDMLAAELGWRIDHVAGRKMALAVVAMDVEPVNDRSWAYMASLASPQMLNKLADYLRRYADERPDRKQGKRRGDA